ESNLLLAISAADKIHHLLQLWIFRILKKSSNTLKRGPRRPHLMSRMHNTPAQDNHLKEFHHLDDRVLAILARHRQARLCARHPALSVPPQGMIQEKLLPRIRIKTIARRQKCSVVTIGRMELWKLRNRVRLLPSHGIRHTSPSPRYAPRLRAASCSTTVRGSPSSTGGRASSINANTSVI